MKKIHVVIGANYGDEGKGRTTAYLANKESNCAVVRFNGGAQAGHTVTRMDFRHVFSHYGSGSADLIPTIFTREFVCSPHLFKKENEQLIRKGVIRPELFVSPDCPVTLPWDVMMNQLSELSRGAGRHGSVGVGFGETLERHQNDEFKLVVADLLLEKDQLISKIEKIFYEYISQRLVDMDLSIDDLVGEWLSLVKNCETVHEVFYQECLYFIDRVTVMDESESLCKFDSLVFEGAQGLALDQESPDFPHVTRSFTGIDNVLLALDRAGITDQINLTYVTRPYFTRHGAGPLPGEEEHKPDFPNYFNVVDETNKPHNFQGTLRFAFHDIDEMSARIVKDQFKIQKKRIGEICVACTCLDQVVEVGENFSIPATIDGTMYMFTKKDFVLAIADKISAGNVIICEGEEDYHISYGKVISKNEVGLCYD